MRKNHKIIILILAFVIVITILILIITSNKTKNDINDTLSDKVENDIHLTPSDNSKEKNIDSTSSDEAESYSNINFNNIEILSLEDIYEMNPDNSLEFDYNAEGYISRIDGVCANFKIHNSDDALKAVYALQDIIAVCDISDLRYLEEVHNAYNDIYRFRQYKDDIAVISGVVTVMADAETKDAYIVNSYCVTSDIEIANKIDKEEAMAIIKKEYEVNNIQKSELVIYHDDFKGNVLAWYIETDSYDAPALYMDANTGNILYVDGPIID